MNEKLKSLMVFLPLFILGYTSTAFSDEDLDPIWDEGPEDGRWAPQTRWVIHPVTGFLVQLDLILELPDKAYYKDHVEPKPPQRGACEVQPEICILGR